MREKVIVLNSETGNLLTGRKLSQLAGYTNLHGMNFVYEGEEELSQDYVQFVFADHADGARLVLVDDYLNDLAYVSLQNLAEPKIHLLMKWLRDNLGAFDLGEIRKRLQEDLEGHSPLLTHLGLMEDAEGKDPVTMGILREALKSTRLETVGKALVAAQLLGWPELKGDVEQVAQHSPTKHLRDFAEKALVQI